MKKTLVPVICLLLGSVLVVIGIYSYQSTNRFLKTAESTQGRVIDQEIRKTGSGRKRKRSFYPIIRFTTENGQEVTFKSDSGSNPPSYNKGDKVDVLYDPENPQEAMVDSFLDRWMLPMIFIGFGSVFGLIGVGVFVAMLLGVRPDIRMGRLHEPHEEMFDGDEGGGI